LDNEAVIEDDLRSPGGVEPRVQDGADLSLDFRSEISI